MKLKCEKLDEDFDCTISDIKISCYYIQRAIYGILIDQQ